MLVVNERLTMAEVKTLQVQGRGVESFADDLVTGLGVVFSRAATILRSVETKPTIGRFAFYPFFPLPFNYGLENRHFEIILLYEYIYIYIYICTLHYSVCSTLY